jgi:hypothetical protein
MCSVRTWGVAIGTRERRADTANRSHGCTHPVIRSRKAGEQPPTGTASALRIAMGSVVDRFVTYSDA